MNPAEQNRQELENQIKNDFLDLQWKLDELKNEIQNETNESKKEEKDREFQKMQEDLSILKTKIDILSSLQEQELQSLKEKIEETKQLYNKIKWETIDLLREKFQTPTTYELLKDSETCTRLHNIIASNPREFKNVPWDTPERKLEYIFSKIRNSMVLFMKNKLWNSEKYDKIIDNTIAPAFERSLLELLRDQWNEENVSMLQWMDKISFSGFWKLVRWVWRFAKKTSWAYSKFSQWVNAVDYLAVHNWVLNNPEKSEILTDPLKFKEYINNTEFAKDEFSPYALISGNIFKVSDKENFEFWISLEEKKTILDQIWNIEVVDNAKTTSLIVKMMDKPEKFLQKAEWLQQTANGLLDWISSLNSVTKIVWVDILWEISKAPSERSFLYKIMDFVCKLIWITWWLEWIVKRWRLDRMNLTDEKNENIGKIFKNYKEVAWENKPVTITDEASCKTALNDFVVTDPQNTSITKWDYLRDSMVDNLDISLVSPAVVQQILWDSYLKKEVTTENWKSKERFIVDESKITQDDKIKLAHNHIINMKNHLEKYKDNDLSDFYANIHSTEDIALCITASLYADKDDVIEWVKAKVFLPENYWSFHSDWTVEDISVMPELTSEEMSEMQSLVEQSKVPNTINYLENATYKKYLNVIEANLWLPKYSLECVCATESKWKLYNWNQIIWSWAWARWLFQFMPDTANQYMKHSKLWEKYWKTFTSIDGFLKDPLAEAWAAGIMYSEFMYKYNYNFQSALACYNRWIGNYRTAIGNRSITAWDLWILPVETKKYVTGISIGVLQRNFAPDGDIFVDFWKYMWRKESVDNIQNKELLIWPALLAHNKEEIGWLWNSIMNWFQWLDAKTSFPYMDGAIWKSTVTHKNRFNSKDDVLLYKNAHPNIKSFMFYFWANTRDNDKTYSDIKQRSEWLESTWIQPVLCTCIWENSIKTPWLKELNQRIISLWKDNNWPVVDFAKSYEKWNITLWNDELHPSSYSPMTNIINELLV